MEDQRAPNLEEMDEERRRGSSYPGYILASAPRKNSKCATKTT